MKIYRLKILLAVLLFFLFASLLVIVSEPRGAPRPVVVQMSSPATLTPPAQSDEGTLETPTNADHLRPPPESPPVPPLPAVTEIINQHNQSTTRAPAPSQAAVLDARPIPLFADAETAAVRYQQELTRVKLEFQHTENPAPDLFARLQELESLLSQSRAQLTYSRPQPSNYQ